MTVEVVRTGAALGAEIRGVDIREPLSSADRDGVLQAWHDNLVVLVREQPMSDAQLMAFTRQFGELELSAKALVKKAFGVSSSFGDDTEAPEIAVISNIVRDGKAIGALGAGEAAWHTDSSFVEEPPSGSFLHAIEIPPQGGATHFLNMYAAYDALSEEMKQRIAGLQAIHSMTHTSGGVAHQGFEGFSDVANAPGARHPLVRTHPDTGRQALFLGRRINAYIVGLPVAESEALLDTLWAHATKPEFTWAHEWHPGDLIVWDNRCAMHRRDSFDPSTRRLLHRTQLKGTKPF